MGNDIQIRVTGRNDSGETMVSVRRGLQETARSAEEVQRAADRAAAAQLASRRATLAATEATERAERSAQAAAEAAEKLAAGELSEAAAAQAAARAERDLERAQIAQAAAAQRAAEATRRQAEHHRMLAESSREAEHEQRQMGDGAERSGNIFQRIGGRITDVLGKVGGGFKKAGTEAAGFATEITGKSGPYGAIAMILAILTALPLAAQLAGAGIALGIGGALAGIGIRAAASNAKIQSEFRALADHVKDSVQDWAVPFESTLHRTADTARSVFDALGPDIKSAFAQIAPEVSDFVVKLGDGLTSFGPMIKKVAADFGPLLRTLGDRMPDLLEHLADALTEISDAADPKTIDLLIDALDGLIYTAAKVIVFLERIGSDLAAAWSKVKEFGSAVGDLFRDANSGDAEEFGRALASVGVAAAKASGGVEDLQSQLSQLAGEQLSAREAARAFEEAIDAASAAARKNGRTLDINTSKGRENQAALDSIAKSALSMRDAMQKSGQDSSTAMNRARGSFIRSAQQMGLTRGEAQRLADKFGLLSAKVRGVPASRRVTVRHNADTVKRGMDLLRGAIVGLPASKHIRIVQEVITIGGNLLLGGLGGHAHGGIIGAAGGGPRSGLVLVGEQGPELVKAAPGSTVIPAGKTRQMLETGRGGDQRIVLELAAGPGEIEQLLVKILRRYVRVHGGDVQAVLGRS